MSLPELSTRYPVTVTMATLAIVLLGWISLGGLGTDLLPNVETPVITVDLRVAGKSPQEMEERYTRRLERDISTVSGVDRVYSMTRSGQTVVVAELDWDTDMDFALLDVQKANGHLRYRRRYRHHRRDPGGSAGSARRQDCGVLDQ